MKSADSYKYEEDKEYKGIVSIVLKDCYHLCTKCRLLKPMSEVGIRVMKDGSIRNQPQCIECRGKK